MHRGRDILRWLALAGALVLVTAPARAITDEEIFRDFRFNFINPGGRSLGMGGAFISIADDATAAQSNPAGLPNLVEPQFFSEIRLVSPDPTDTNVRFRDPFLPDQGFDVQVNTRPVSTISPSFVSYVHPVGSLWLGVSRQEVINSDSETSNGYDFLLETGSYSTAGEGRINVDLTHLNVSVGWKAHERLRLGATLSHGTLSLESAIVNTFTDPTGAIIGDPGLAGTPIEMYRTVANDRDSTVTFAVGLQWLPTQAVSVGAVYRRGGDYGVDETLIGKPVDPGILPGQIAQTVFFNESGTLLTADNDAFRFVNELHVPDQWGIGVAYRPTLALTLALDVVRIEYSDLLGGFNSRLNVLTSGFAEERLAAFRVDDRTHLHLGAEYLIQSAGGLTSALRAGFHQDRDNRIRSDFAPGGFGQGSNATFPGRDDADHYSLGFGVVLNERFQVDVAVDFSDLGTETVASVIYSF